MRKPPGVTNKIKYMVANPDSNTWAGVKLGSFKFKFLCRLLNAIKVFGWCWFRRLDKIGVMLFAEVTIGMYA